MRVAYGMNFNTTSNPGLNALASSQVVMTRADNASHMSAVKALHMQQMAV
jgi:hypothetical protein